MNHRIPAICSPANIFFVAIEALIVRVGVAGQSLDLQYDQNRFAVLAQPLNDLTESFVSGNGVPSVQSMHVRSHKLVTTAVGKRIKRLACGSGRDGPLIVFDEKYDRQATADCLRYRL